MFFYNKTDNLEPKTLKANKPLLVLSFVLSLLGIVAPISIVLFRSIFEYSHFVFLGGIIASNFAICISLSKGKGFTICNLGIIGTIINVIAWILSLIFYNWLLNHLMF